MKEENVHNNNKNSLIHWRAKHRKWGIYESNNRMSMAYTIIRFLRDINTQAPACMDAHMARHKQSFKSTLKRYKKINNKKKYKVKKRGIHFLRYLLHSFSTMEQKCGVNGKGPTLEIRTAVRVGPIGWGSRRRTGGPHPSSTSLPPPRTSRTCAAAAPLLGFLLGPTVGPIESLWSGIHGPCSPLAADCSASAHPAWTIWSLWVWWGQCWDFRNRRYLSPCA